MAQACSIHLKRLRRSNTPFHSKDGPFKPGAIQTCRRPEIESPPRPAKAPMADQISGSLSSNPPASRFPSSRRNGRPARALRSPGTLRWQRAKFARGNGAKGAETLPPAILTMEGACWNEPSANMIVGKRNTYGLLIWSFNWRAWQISLSCSHAPLNQPKDGRYEALPKSGLRVWQCSTFI